MDKELQEIKNSLDSITNNMYGLSQLGDLVPTLKEMKESLDNIGQIGLKPGEWSGSSGGARLGDIKDAIESLHGNSGGGGGGSTAFNPQLGNLTDAIDRNTQMVEKMVGAVRTIAEIHLQQLSLQESTAAEFAVLPWSKENPTPNLDYGWVEDLEQPTGEVDLEDASL